MAVLLCFCDDGSTYLNAPEATTCEMCGAEVKPPTHDVQSNGRWKCGSCAMTNAKGVKECCHCHVPFYSVVTSSAPSQIFCSRCGFLNDGGNLTCVQCDNTIRSTLDKISTDLRDSTNFLARDMGVNINVKCPGCTTICFVPPATACLRCGTCHTYFASPSVGEVTNFHMSRLASSISSSFMGLFGGQNRENPSLEAPVGRLLAMGELVNRSSPQSSSSASSDAPPTGFDLGDENEEKEEVPGTRRREPSVEKQYLNPVRETRPPRLLAAAIPVEEASQNLVKVEGDIVEL